MLIGCLGGQFASAEEIDPYASVPHQEGAAWGKLVPLPFTELFDLPVGLVHLPDGSTLIACQRGMFYRVRLGDPSQASEGYLDFRDMMEGAVAFEDGVHGIALHPQFESNGRIFLSYSQNDPRRAVLSEMVVSLDRDFAPFRETERVIFELEQPLADHWGGQILFGPDGMLYIGLGDGGLRDDPYRMSQNLWALHGKILRIDVDREDGNRRYGIPADNPFVGMQLMREEIFASGLRNPWGMAFDPVTGYLWCADVGQDYWEEVNRITPGGNYGWSDRDGPGPLAAHPEPLLKDSVPINPVFAYTRNRGEGICIIGGMVYRGKRFPELQGSYLYGEWGFGLVEALELAEDQSEASRRTTLYRKEAEGPTFNPVFLGEDPDGELVVLSHNGSVWVLERAE